MIFRVAVAKWLCPWIYWSGPRNIKATDGKATSGIVGGAFGNTVERFVLVPVLDYKTCRGLEERRRDGF
jgi:lipoprotein signal peptidase